MEKETLEQSLKQFFGYDTFRPGQKDIIEKALTNRDLLVIMPTGGGKSLCFQLPALLKKGITIVVSPLIALMQDQVDSLLDNGIGATFLNSSLNWDELKSRELAILNGKIKLLYVAPERLLSEKFLFFLDRLKSSIGIAGFAIDEAHCVSEWGHDFRPEYRKMILLRYRYGDIPIMALTATATERVKEDIIKQLGLQNADTYLSSFNRPNLYYEVKPKERQSYNQLLTYIRTHQGAGIIYCLSRKNVDDLTFRLQQDNVSALPYHAGLNDEVRVINQNRFIRDDVRIIVATIAFGMGINKPDVRFVIHYNLPRTLENYYQESGRAGRDGEKAKCILFFTPSDIKRIDYLIEQQRDENQQKISRQQLRKMIDYSEGTECRRIIQLSYFGEKFKGNCGNCDNCLQPKPLENWTIEAQKFLSCVARCKEKFGMTHIIDILRGSSKKKIMQYGHHLLSTYGIGKDRTMEEWRMLGRSLLHQGLLSETTDGYSVLKLNKKSWEILKKEREVNIAVTLNKKDQLLKEYNLKNAQGEILFDRLRALRKYIADHHSIAPYVIFPDSTLRLMAQMKPKTLEDFGKMSGVTEYKLKQYGDQFLSEIRSFCQEQSLPIKLPSNSEMITLSLHQQGLNIGDISKARNLAVGTIYTHLSNLIEMKQPVEINHLITPEKRQEILKVIEVKGDISLTPLKEELGDNYSYNEIRLVRSWWRKQKS
jgi:ATP-dependent DNA helicase RecQ